MMYYVFCNGGRFCAGNICSDLGVRGTATRVITWLVHQRRVAGTQRTKLDSEVLVESLGSGLCHACMTKVDYSIVLRNPLANRAASSITSP